MVRDHEAVENVIFGEGGCIYEAFEGTTFIDMSTISPDSSKDIASRLKKKGFHFLDAPVSGSTWAAESGTLAIMAGGEKEIFEKHRDIVEIKGSKMAKRDFSTQFSLDLMYKDLLYIVDALGKYWVFSPVTPVAKEIFMSSFEKGTVDLDYSSVFETIEKMSKG